MFFENDVVEPLEDFKYFGAITRVLLYVKITEGGGVKNPWNELVDFCRFFLQFYSKIS